MNDLIASFLLAGIGSLITFFAGFVIHRTRDYRLRKKYPVAGSFITEYEDQTSSGPVFRKASTTLKQKGREIRGSTVDLDTGRAWEIKGIVESGGFLYGIYIAEDPHDFGRGTFFLKINGATGDMGGLWAGYDSAISSISQGAYRFKRSPRVKIVVANDADVSNICALLGDALGALYVDLESIRSYVAQDNKSDTCLIAVDHTGKIAGALTVSIVASGMVSDMVPSDKSECLRALPTLTYHEHICVIRSVAVVPHLRGRGIATQLVRQAIEWSQERGATAAISFGWKSSQGCHIEGVMTAAGFDCIKEVPRFWTEDSRNRGYSCPECGQPCNCSAVIFRRRIGSLASSPPRAVRA